MYATKKKLFVYDWELASENIPLFFDFFHYVFQRNILIKHKRYKEIKKELHDYLNTDILKKLIQKYEININQYFSYYLYLNCSYYGLKYYQQKELHIQGYWLIDVWCKAIEDIINNNGEIFETK
jgi:hypothetical protein